MNLFLFSLLLLNTTVFAKERDQEFLLRMSAPVLQTVYRLKLTDKEIAVMQTAQKRLECEVNFGTNSEHSTGWQLGILVYKKYSTDLYFNTTASYYDFETAEEISATQKIRSLEALSMHLTPKGSLEVGLQNLKVAVLLEEGLVSWEQVPELTVKNNLDPKLHQDIQCAIKEK